MNHSLPVELLEEGRAGLAQRVEGEEAARAFVEEVSQHVALLRLGVHHQVANHHLGFGVETVGAKNSANPAMNQSGSFSRGSLRSFSSSVGDQRDRVLRDFRGILFVVEPHADLGCG